VVGGVLGRIHIACLWVYCFGLLVGLARVVVADVGQHDSAYGVHYDQPVVF